MLGEKYEQTLIVLVFPTAHFIFAVRLPRFKSQPKAILGVEASALLDNGDEEEDDDNNHDCLGLL